MSLRMIHRIWTWYNFSCYHEIVCWLVVIYSTKNNILVKSADVVFLGRKPAYPDMAQAWAPLACMIVPDIQNSDKNYLGTASQE